LPVPRKGKGLADLTCQILFNANHIAA